MCIALLKSLNGAIQGIKAGSRGIKEAPAFMLYPYQPSFGIFSTLSQELEAFESVTSCREKELKSLTSYPSEVLASEVVATLSI